MDRTVHLNDGITNYCNGTFLKNDRDAKHLYKKQITETPSNTIVVLTVPKLTKYDKVKLIEAVKDVQNGIESYRTADKKCGIPKSTIEFKLKHPEHKDTLGPSPILTCKEENTLLRYTYEHVVQTAKFLIDKIPQHLKPKIGIICGSGMGEIANGLQESLRIPYKDIPNFPVSTVEGHAGQLVFGTLSDVPIVCMQGRFHYYEGYPLWKCAMPVRVMKLIGVTHLIATNAAGGLNKGYKVGDIMIVRDHINIMGFAGNNPLQGPNDERFGPRFPPMNSAYEKTLIKRAKQIAVEENISHMLHEGVYTCLGGPNFETVAELRMLRMLGVDAVGMSTVHEVITARHCNLTVLAFSLITNACITEYDVDEEANHEEVIDVGLKMGSVLKRFVTRLVELINKETDKTMG